MNKVFHSNEIPRAAVESKMQSKKDVGKGGLSVSVLEISFLKNIYNFNV